MKKIALSILVLLIAAQSFSQSKNDWHELNKELHKKGKIPKALPWISLGIGVPTIILSIAAGYTNYDKKNYMPVFVTGCVLTAGSIPLFILAYPHPKPRKLNFRFSIDSQKILSSQRNAFAVRTIPALTMRINF